MRALSLGEHSVVILRDTGFSKDEVDDLVQAGVVQVE